MSCVEAHIVLLDIMWAKITQRQRERNERKTERMTEMHNWINQWYATVWNQGPLLHSDGGSKDFIPISNGIPYLLEVCVSLHICASPDITDPPLNSNAEQCSRQRSVTVNNTSKRMYQSVIFSMVYPDPFTSVTCSWVHHCTGWRRSSSSTQSLQGVNVLWLQNTNQHLSTSEFAKLSCVARSF